jgi:hypothetical protein
MLAFDDPKSGDLLRATGYLSMACAPERGWSQEVIGACALNRLAL